MSLACSWCGEEFEDRPQEAVEDSFREEVVAHTFNPDSIAVAQTDYYCDPECFAAAVEEDVVSEPVEVKDALTDGGEDIPPARDGEINRIPDLQEGDRIRVRTKHTHDPNRNLTVADADPDEEALLGLQPKTVWGSGDDQYILEGYGTRYLLTTFGTPHWRSVCLVWQSNRHGEAVRCIEVREGEAEDVLAAVTDGGKASTIVGDPQHPAETADMTPYDGPPEDFDGLPDPQTVACPTCGAEEGEPCVYFGGKGAGEPIGRAHTKRRSNARSARGGGDE